MVLPSIAYDEMSFTPAPGAVLRKHTSALELRTQWPWNLERLRTRKVYKVTAKV